MRGIIKGFYKVAIISTLILFVSFRPISAEDADVIPPYEKVIENIYSQREEDFSAIVVEKSSNTLFLVSVEKNIPHVSRIYEVITGKNGGDKEKTGDKKTPEGIYFVTGYIPGIKLIDPIYGVGAFPINYPNIVDKINGKTGNGIWIHGRDEFNKDIKTRGCVSLNNNDFEDLRKRISIDVPVVIAERAAFIPSDDYQEQRARYFDHLMKFISAWETGDFKTFSLYFDEKFRTVSGLSYQAYLTRKKNLMNAYEERKIDISDIVIFKENSREFVYSFNQFYCSTNMMSFGKKVLYLEEEDEVYKIVAEEFFKRSSRNYIMKTTNEFVGRWRNSWMSQDIQTYISFYDNGFTDGRVDLQGWKEYKEGLFRRTQIRDITIENIQLKVLAPQRIQVTFTQNYSANDYSDRGIKTLILSGCPETLKILSEEWQPF